MITRSRLAYPSGTRPGLDPRHPASVGIWNGFSCVAHSTAFLNLVSARRVALTIGTSTVQNGMQGLTGWMTGLTASATTGNFEFNISAASNLSTVQQTVACICVPQALAQSSVQTLTSTNSSNTGLGLAIANSSSVFATNVSSVNNVSSLTAVVGHPYFVAASITTTTLHMVVADLSTGKIVSNAFAAAYTLSSANTFFLLNVPGSGSSFAGLMAAAMQSSALLTAPQLLAWANDPWSFWYPRRAQNLAGHTTVAGPKPGSRSMTGVGR